MGDGGSDLLKDLFDLGNGIRSGIQDVPKLFQDVVTLDAHGALTDGRKVIGDVGDVLNGLGGLGMGLTEVPRQIAEKYAGSALGKLADSKILSAAQLAIEAEKATTGSGDPEDGNGYHDSAVRMQEVVQTLSDADPRDDRWNGRAAETYTATNSAHRKHASAVQGADQEIANILGAEATQVSRTRRTLDETNQYLSDYGAATAWMNFVPGLAQAKAVADIAAASAALLTTNTTMQFSSPTPRRMRSVFAPRSTVTLPQRTFLQDRICRRQSSRARASRSCPRLQTSQMALRRGDSTTTVRSTFRVPMNHRTVPESPPTVPRRQQEGDQ